MKEHEELGTRRDRIRSRNAIEMLLDCDESDRAALFQLPTVCMIANGMMTGPHAEPCEREPQKQAVFIRYIVGLALDRVLPLMINDKVFTPSQCETVYQETLEQIASVALLLHDAVTERMSGIRGETADTVTEMISKRLSDKKKD